jgi:fucokinase
VTPISSQGSDAYIEAGHAAPARSVVKPGSTWWDVVVLTASNSRQAEWYRNEIDLRLREGGLPPGATYMVVPDRNNRRIGSGSATILALAELARAAPPLQRASPWEHRRILMIHSGGDARRLPQYSPQGKLFGVMPRKRQGRCVATSVFDETMALSTAWAERMPCGVVVMAGDMVLEFAARDADWSRPGVTGVAIRMAAETGCQHGVYVADERGRVYTFLQKPSLADLKAAGALMDDGRAAVDTGLLRFDPDAAARLASLAASEPVPPMDLYDSVTRILAGQPVLEPENGPFWVRLREVLRGLPFHCSVVDGSFTHIGTTRHFRSAAAGGVIDSSLGEGSRLAADAVVVECALEGRVLAGQGSVLHGLDGIAGPVEVPENTVVHQVPVLTEDGRRGTVVRVYGVEDDPRMTGATGDVTWFGRPVLETLAEIGLCAGDVWPEIAAPERSLWNAQLFPAAASPQEAWGFALWMVGFPVIGAAADLRDRWLRCERMSLETSALLTDGRALLEARTRRMQLHWQEAAITLSLAGADLKPMLARAPGLAVVASTGGALLRNAAAMAETGNLSEAASQFVQASRFLGHSGLEDEAGRAEKQALACVARAVSPSPPANRPAREPGWRHDRVEVSSPARIDLGGGWTDTPPFCYDWGGTVLNIAVELNGRCPIRATVERIAEPVIRCVSTQTGEAVTWRDAAELMTPPEAGSTVAIPRACLQLVALLQNGETLQEALGRRGGGIEIRTEVHLPVGSGLGASSILAATVMVALSEMEGRPLDDQTLSTEVLRLEQLLTTGGGWQDHVGGTVAGAKLLNTGPGREQRIRVRPVEWSPQRMAEFEQRLVLCDTGIQRMARDLVRQVVCSYLARETHTVQALHGIKTIATEMAYAMSEGEWDYFGSLMDRHWQLNLRMDPHMTNALIDSLLASVRPLIAGAKLAGAGGGGFMMMLARGVEEARELRRRLAQRACDWRIAAEGLRWTSS